MLIVGYIRSLFCMLSTLSSYHPLRAVSAWINMIWLTSMRIPTSRFSNITPDCDTFVHSANFIVVSSTDAYFIDNVGFLYIKCWHNPVDLMSSSLIRLKFRPSVTQLHFQPLSPFLPRDVIHSEDYTRLSVRPSVRLSVRHTVVSYQHSYRQTNITKLFSSSRRHIILVFFHTKRRRAHAKGGVDCKGDEKITIFGKYIALSPKWYKIVL